MPARQASFGGVAALFGSDDPEEEDNAPTQQSRKQQPSFGGVASLFGSADDDDVGAVSAPAPNKARGQQPSFGGVAAMFGDPEEDEKPPSQIITKKPKTGNRTASFGGVAALFGGDPSDEETGSAAPASGTISGLFSTDTVGNLPKTEEKKPQRKGKRDPSVSGVFGLFGDEEEETPKQESVDRSSIHDQLRKQAKVEEIRVRQLDAELEQAEIKSQELQDQMKTIQQEMEDMKQTKLALITSTAKEIDRMRRMLRVLHTSSGGETDQGKAATVS